VENFLKNIFYKHNHQFHIQGQFEKLVKALDLYTYLWLQSL